MVPEPQSDPNEVVCALQNFTQSHIEAPIPACNSEAAGKRKGSQGSKRYGIQNEG